MIPKRAHFSWLARKAQAAARARRLIPPLLLSVFIVLSSVSNTVAQVGWSTPMPSWDGPAPATSVADRCFTGNLNGDRSNPDGDRMTDFWCTTGTGSSTWLIGISTGSGWSISMWDGPIPGLPQPVGGTNLLSSCITGDLNGDGKSDIYCQYLISVFPLLFYSSAGLSTGSGWSTSSWAPLPHAILFAWQCLTGDLDRDGKTDVWCETFAGNWSVGLSTGSGWTTMTWNGPAPVWGISSGLRVSDQCLTGDLDGDGRTDMWCQITPGSGIWQIAISTGSGWTMSTFLNGPAPGIPVKDYCFTGDLNRDGMADMWCETSSGSGTWSVALSTGSGWLTSTVSGPAPGIPVKDYCFTGDLNRDGMTDMWCETSSGSGMWDIAISTGSGWVTSPNVSGPTPSTPIPSSCLVGDANGDGLVDFWCETSSGSGIWTMALAVEPPPTITSAGTATGQVGVAFSYQMTATNSPTSFGATGLPAGMALDATSGLISGTPTSAGASTVTLSATNAGGTGTQTLAVTINPATEVAPLLP
ncbi:MAG: hypothetical protein E6K57_02515 [Nitrospirae bacterium]|nr:MAG: hypothetical protein E6K57_02515 [Nitrospirota bacterium]